MRTGPKEQKFWFLIKGHSKGSGETFLPLYNSVFISLPGYVCMFIWCLWDIRVNKKASIWGPWAQVPSWVKTHASDPLLHQGFGFFPLHAWPYTVCGPCPPATSCPLDAHMILVVWCLLAFYYWGMFWPQQTRVGTQCTHCRQKWFQKPESQAARSRQTTRASAKERDPYNAGATEAVTFPVVFLCFFWTVPPFKHFFYFVFSSLLAVLNPLFEHGRV